MNVPNFYLSDAEVPFTSETAVAGVLSDDGFLTLSQRMNNADSDVVVLSPAMIAQLRETLLALDGPAKAPALALAA